MLNTENLVRRVNGSEKSKKILTVCSLEATLNSVFVFIYMLFCFLGESILLTAEFLIILGAPFVLVTLLRKFVGAPRPYEVYDFLENPPRKGEGDSFPSRHCFSIFAIGTLCLFVSPVIGAITLALGIVLCFARVALGIHFVRDVVAGALMGVCTSLIGGFVFLM